MPAIICKPAGTPSVPHSAPQTIGVGQDAALMVPLRNSLFGSVSASLSFRIPSSIDLVFKGIGKVRTAARTVDEACVFTSTDYKLEGTGRGTVFIDVSVDGSSQTSIQVDVV